MSDIKKQILIKPSIDTPFHIDFDWWKNHDNNWRIFLHSCLCNIHQESFTQKNSESWIDWVDQDTAEIHQVDGLQHILITHCAKQPDFITNQSVLVDAVFRLFLSNGNIPMSSKEISEHIGKPAETIVRTLAGSHVYKGIRPIQGI